MYVRHIIRAIGVSHTACKEEFRQNIGSHSWSVYSFFILLFDMILADMSAVGMCFFVFSLRDYK